MRRFVSVLFASLMLCAARAEAAPSRIKDLVDVEGVRQNQLVGYGLVVGLNGTGDKLKDGGFTKQSLQSMLNRLGVKPTEKGTTSKNVAAVMVTAALPPFARQGSRIDVSVSALGDASSLLGGTLLVTPLLGADGEVYAAGGRTLVDGTATTLSHIVATGADASVTYAKGDFDGIYVGDGNDITGDIRSGELSGLIEMRDKVLPDLQSSLDALATALRDTVNAVHNRGTGFPGLVAMAGSRVFNDPASQTITFGGTSDTALVLLDADGAEVRHTTIRELFGGSTGPFKIQGDAGTPAIDGIDEAINTWLAGDGTAEVTNGRLAITVKSAGLTLALRDQVAGAAGSTGQDADIHFDADGDGNADQTAAGFSSFFGLNDFFIDQASPDETGQLVVGAASSMEVRADIVADPSLVSRGAVQWDASRVPSGGYAVSAGDDTVVEQMAMALAASADFAAVGRLPAMNTGLADYAASLISDASALASETDGTSEFQQNLVDTLRQKSDSVRGVNLDEELSDLMLYEQSYSAAARVVGAIKDMFDVLDRAVG